MMEFKVQVKQERSVEVEFPENLISKRNVEEREKELLGLEISEMELKRKELECSISSLEQKSEEKLKVLEVVEGSVKEALMKLKGCAGLIKDVEVLQTWKKNLELKIEDLGVHAEEQCQLLERRERELELKIKKFENRVKAFKIREKEYQLKKVQFVDQSKLLDRRERELELRMKDFEDKVKAFALGEKEFQLKGKSVVKEKRVFDGSLSVDNDSSKFQVVLDGEDVHMLLGGHRINLTSRDEVSKALQLSGDPAMLVLEALEVLYPPYLVKIGFKGNAGRICMLLLEQLVVVSANIRSIHKEHALKLALKWKDTLCIRNSSEVLAFLYLLASFGLAPSFDTKDVLKLFQTVAEHENAPALCHRLGLKHKMSGLIKKLIKKKQRILAIEYAHVFNLVHLFPPVDLLEEHVLDLKSAAKKPGTEDLTISDEMTGLKKVLKCISDHKLESEYSPASLVERVAELEASRRKLMTSGTRKRTANEVQAPPPKRVGR